MCFLRIDLFPYSYEEGHFEWSQLSPGFVAFSCYSFLTLLVSLFEFPYFLGEIFSFFSFKAFCVVLLGAYSLLNM